MAEPFLCKNSPIVRRIFFSMLVPTILMNLTTAIASFADTVIIGYFLDDLSLSVVTYATPIYMIINTFAALFAVGGSIAIGIDSGKGDKAGANRAFSLATELLIASGFILTVGGLVLADNIPIWLGAGSDASGWEVFKMVRSYSAIIMVSAPVFMLNVGLAFFVRNDGRPTLSMVGMILSIVINIIFDIAFIGTLDLGVAGAAYATVLGQFVSAVVIAGHFLSKKNTLRFQFAFGKDIVRIVKNGGGTALHFIYQFITILIINHLVTKFAGINGVVVYTVVFNLYTVSLALYEGISQTIQPMISLFYGENNIVKIKQTLKMTLITVFVICGMVTLVLEGFPQIVPVIFGVDDMALVVSCSTAVRIFSASMIIMTVNVVIGYYLQSTEHSFFAVVLVSLRCFVIFLLGALVLGYFFGMNGIWASYAVAEALTFIIYMMINAALCRRLQKKYGETNFLLLSKAVEKSTLTYVWNSDGEDGEKFTGFIADKLRERDKLNHNVAENAVLYINDLIRSNAGKKDKLIEIDIIEEEGRVVIRDDFNHAEIQKNIQSYLCGEESDYSPALGFNRICLK